MMEETTEDTAALISSSVGDSLGEGSLSLKKGKESMFKSALRNVTIEPVMFLHMIGMTLTSLTVQNVYLDRICRIELGYSDEVCRALLENTSNKTIEEDVDGIASKYSLYRSMVESFVPVFFAMFLGPWSDKHGSKFPLLLPLFGAVLSSAFYTFFTFARDIPPMYLILSSIPMSLSGGMVCLVLSMLSYITNVTTDENRSARLAALEACWFLGSPIGTLGGAKLYKAVGFPPVFICAAACYAIALCYGMIFLENDKPEEEMDESSNCCSDMFNIAAVKDMLSAVFARREPPRRLWLLLLVFVMMAKVMTMVGSAVCLFLFTRHQFNWNEQNFSTYSTVNTFVGVGGTVLMTVVGLKILKLGDTFVAIISTACCVATDLTIAFAPEDPKMAWILYLASAVSMFGGMTTIMARSMFSKIVSNQEVAKIFTFIACMEIAIVPLVGSTAYSALYRSTQKILPGAFSLVNAGTNGTILLILIYLFISMRRAPDVVEISEHEEEEDRRHAINT